MSEIDSKSPIMTPQISPKDVPQSKSDSETEDEPVVANIIDEASSSEDDDDGDIVNEISGYVPLSMNDGNDDSYSNTIEIDEQESSGQFQEENAESPESNSSREDQLSMDNDQVKLIQQVMSNISLPTTSIPEWARVVPEDRWKNTLLSTLENRTTHNSDSKEISE